MQDGRGIEAHVQHPTELTSKAGASLVKLKSPKNFHTSPTQG
jgi:hypothetical protein